MNLIIEGQATRFMDDQLAKEDDYAYWLKMRMRKKEICSNLKVSNQLKYLVCFSWNWFNMDNNKIMMHLTWSMKEDGSKSIK